MKQAVQELAGGDMYFELGYSFEYFGFIGSGDGWHTSDGMNLQYAIWVFLLPKKLRSQKSILLASKWFSDLNPETEQYHVVVGVSF